MRRFYAQPKDIRDGLAILGPDEAHHMRTVVRLRPGDPAVVFDGEGRSFHCEVTSIEKHQATLTIIREMEFADGESLLDLELAAGLLKGEKFDLVVQKAVELGVKRLLPLVTVRSEARSAHIEKRLERWRRIALEAAKQSGRTVLIDIKAPVDLASLFADRAGRTTLFFTETGGGPLTAAPADRGITAVIGPEGGWDDAEIEMAKEYGACLVTLKGRTMRAETAAIAITAIVQHRFGDLN